jgi:magnesium-transporting ATPase (P-type)
MPAPSGDECSSLSPNEVLRKLASSDAGLSNSEAAARFAAVGPNELPRPRGQGWTRRLARQFVHWLALLLWIAAVLACVAGMPELAWAVVAVIVINGCFSFWQEYRAQKAVDALDALMPRNVVVRREGVQRQIPAREVVPGDVIVLAEGGLIPADARVIRDERLRVDASALTGESRPNPRTAERIDPAGKGVLELANLVFGGTTVASGRGEAVVYATGTHTQFGMVASLTRAQKERPSPLAREITHLIRWVTLVSVVLGAACFLLGTLWGGLTVRSAFLFAIGMLVANVPEGLLPTLTLSLAMAVRRMAGRNALVKHLTKVEALGSTTVILTDKTGTLTQNEMTVCRAWTAGSEFRFEGTGYNPQGRIVALDPARDDRSDLSEMVRTAALCCDAELRPPDGHSRTWTILGDPMEAALRVASLKAVGDAEGRNGARRVVELPFDSTRKRMTAIEEVDGRLVACVKGAPEILFERCHSIQHGGEPIPFDNSWSLAASQAQERLAGNGLRVLAVARRDLGPAPSPPVDWRGEDVERNLTLLGLLALEDPPRPDVSESIASCRRAGIRVIMVTGDHGPTAAAIGREIGLVGADARLVTGRELDGLSPDQLANLLTAPDLLFSRVRPDHKLRLVEALQQRGNVVAVTGDGVNDAPALKRADVGVAMGLKGTDVAREAADVVLIDDRFGSIVAAIEEGRCVYDNVRKFVTYILASNVPEFVPFVAYVLCGIPLPLTVMQILAVDLGTDLLPALALGAEPPEGDLMARPPRPQSARLVDGPLLARSYGWIGVWEAVLCLAGYFAVYLSSGWRPGQPMADTGPVYLAATTMSLAGIVACQIANVFVCRTAMEWTGRRGWFSNRLLLWGIAAEIAILLALLHVPSLAGVFGLAPLTWGHWAILGVFPAVLLTAEEGRKWLWRRRAGAHRVRGMPGPISVP